MIIWHLLPFFPGFHPHCRILYVGKQAGHHFMKQEQINELLIKLASEGLKVVRLKGGDSFVFGRGSEEILALREHGISWEVVPGITSLCCSAGTGGDSCNSQKCKPQLSCDHRSHLKKAPSQKKNWLPTEPVKEPLVFLMGLNNLNTISAGLIKGGKPANTIDSSDRRRFPLTASG